VHDLRMDQGSLPPHDRDDEVWQDGGLIVRFPGGPTSAFSFAFQSQVWTSDDTREAPAWIA
jgi:uncharacterized protein YukJ